ncbi:MAG: adenosylcobalamin-dependent ribonucleoside-diphosphate reductase [Candidatus Caldarchaeum sp.]
MSRFEAVFPSGWTGFRPHQLKAMTAIHPAMKVVKRDGSLEDFDSKRILNAVLGAMGELGKADVDAAVKVTDEVVNILASRGVEKPHVEEIQDLVELSLMRHGLYDVAKAYITYRKRREEERAEKRAILGVEPSRWTKKALSVNAVRLLASRYLLRDEKGLAETPEGMVYRVASAIAVAEAQYDSRLVPLPQNFLKNEYILRDLRRLLERCGRPQDFVDNAIPEKVAKTFDDFSRLMFNKLFLPNSPTLFNAGTRLGQLSACFVLPIDDTLAENNNGILPVMQKTALIFQTGGGVGINYSKLRPEGDYVSSSGGVASGPVSFMSLVDKVADVIKQGGRRRAANMGILEAWHPDIMKFIKAKENGGFENFNISVMTDQQFWTAYYEGRQYSLVNPRTGMKVGEIDPRGLLSEIAKQAWATGDPGLLFKHHINRRNPLRKALGDIVCTNPCGEQPLYPYESCNLGSINLYEHVDRENRRIDWEKLKNTVFTAVRFLDDAIDVNRHPFEELTTENLRHRRIGLGIMGLADMLYALHTPYDSEEGFRLMREVMEFVSYHAYVASAELARERGSFQLFNVSSYPEGLLPVEGFYNRQLWTLDWDEVADMVAKGIRNSHVTTVAPTGSISMIFDVSAGLEPQFALVYEKHVSVGKFYYVDIELEKQLKENGLYTPDILRKIAENGGSVIGLDEIPEEMRAVFVTAREIAWWDHLRAQWEIQKWVDSSVSKTINMPSWASVEDVEKAYVTAEKIGVKGITVFRDTSKGAQVLHASPVKSVRKAFNMTAELFRLGKESVLA